MGIHQLSVHYLEDQDRILLRLNTAQAGEVQIWLTRRLTLKLWPLLNRIVRDHLAIPEDTETDGFVDLALLDSHSKQMLLNSRKEESLRAADFSTPYQVSAKSRPLGDTPLLVSEVSLTPTAQGQLHWDLKESRSDTSAQRSFQMDLPPQMVFALLKLMDQALEHSGWMAPTEPLSPALSADDGDLGALVTRPMYLN